MWHIEQDGQAKGPYTDDQLKALCEANVVRAKTLVWRQGYAKWLPLAESDFPFKGAATSGGARNEAPPTAVQQFTWAGPKGDALENLSMWHYFARCTTSRYVQFRGRATRKEYWSFVLFNWFALMLAALVGLLIDYAIGNLSSESSQHAPIAMLVMLMLMFAGLWLPHLAAMVRRLHDAGLSGWLVLISLFPYLGGIVVLVLLLLPGEAADNTHGPATRLAV